MTLSSTKYFKYGYRHHRGGLDESMKTRVYITENGFKGLLLKDGVKFYGYDQRVHQFLWLDTMSYTWYFIELCIYAFSS